MDNKNSGEEATFSISGKIKLYTLIYVITSLMGIGGLVAKVNTMNDRIEKIEQQIDTQHNQYSNMIGSLIRIEENAKFLKEKLEDMKNARIQK